MNIQTDNTDADPDYHPKGPKDLLPTEDEQLENDVIVMADFNPSNNNETELSNDKGIGNYFNFYYSNLLKQRFYLHVLNCNVLEPKRPKKVIPKPLQWKANVRKAKRNSSQEYITRTNKVVPSRKVEPSRDDKCRLHCKNKFTEIGRQTIFEEFWVMGDIENQHYYISKAMKTVTPKYRYVRADATCNRSNNQVFLSEVWC